jgi:hypothetical protein
MSIMIISGVKIAALGDERHGDWRRSSRCTPNNNCVELSIASGAVAVRDSKNLASLPLMFGHRQWRDFLARSVL